VNDEIIYINLGKAYEMHTGNETQPSIVVHICDDPVGYENRPSKIEQTRRPEPDPKLN